MSVLSDFYQKVAQQAGRGGSALDLEYSVLKSRGYTGTLLEMRAKYALSKGWRISDYMKNVAIYGFGVAPGAPTGVSAVAGNAQATVSFTAPASPGDSAITGYRVTSSTGQTATGSASPIVVTGLTNGVAVTFTVAAQNSTAGYGPESAASASVTPSAVTTPGAPTIGTATAANKSVTFAFTPPASDGGSPITGYRVTVSPGGATFTGASSPIVATGLTNGVAYTGTVAAQNANGYGPESAASNSATPFETVGPELTTNGGFDSDSAWTKGAGWTISGGVASQNRSVGTGALTQAITSQPAGTYRCTFTVTSITSAGVWIAAGAPGATRTSTGTYSEDLVSGSDVTAIEFYSSGTGSFSIDNVSVKQIT